ncbi:RNA polymerase-associated protein RapA [Conservatibacter flavescens]|uniref:RNA polymerase-associated protein RapA n=1 Tax=Conservatibacter flavescens TaxID=28161 RepID=A0A2M8S060_9PAST|nr:RNA polymerase-associated protein RapA [Conservatibacter flavescens]PJG84541.1 RNA polymerase-associated protein RapA [Conservatibacter flavescens]
MVFAVGQRWISEGENNLGLGVIVGVEIRTVTILFPASDEKRVYALASAPLTRVQFQINDRIFHQDGWSADVLEVLEQEGVFTYRARCVETQAEVLIPEKALSHHMSVSKPQERLWADQIDRNEHFVTRYQALLNQQAQFQSSLRGLRGFRANLIPHQLHIAQSISQRIAPRVLLADEVGLGKTLEAGMILQQQLLVGKVERALIIVPENLQHQWLVEMLRRFNLAFSLFDEERCADFAPTEEEEKGVNPFETESLIICALDWLEQYPQRVEQIRQAGFDFLIVDEAHHLAWTEHAPSVEYQLIEQLAHVIPAVLLLTATPEQLGQESHFARLRLLDPHRFYDYQAFVQEQQHYQPVAQAVNILLNGQQLTDTDKNHIAALLTEQDVEPLFKAIASQTEESDHARQELITQLIDRHGTSRVLFRNTRQSVKGFPHRIYHQITLEQPKQYANAMNVVSSLGELDLKTRFNPEQIFQQIHADVRWWEFDPRVEWLLQFIKTQRNEKILVICQRADTAIQLEQALREKEGIRAAVFHERLSIVERDRAAAYFAQQEEGAQILLSSSIGSEGRNFQFACHLVLFNLPDSPDLLEQCIGRLDRIGQLRDIHIHVPCFANSPQARLAQWYHEGLNAFEETCPMGETLFEKCGEKLQFFLQNPTALADFESFIRQTRHMQQHLKQALEQGRDRLLEFNSSGGEAAQQLAERIAKADGSPDLVNFALNLFDIIGVEQEDLGEKSIVLSPTGHMLIPDFPGLKEEGITITFDRQQALVREDIEFLTWDHPMIRQGIDLITTGDIGKTTVALLVNKGLPVGTLLLELIYVVDVQAPNYLQLNRFLPPTPIRVLLDVHGTNIASQVSFNGLNKQLKPLSKNMAIKVVKMAKAKIVALLAKAEKQVPNLVENVLREAKQRADSTLSYELTRLYGLKAVNKTIRQSEIEALEQVREQSLQQIEQATWRLDSLRVIISNKE